MNKLILTIKPQHLCNILNGFKTIEVRKNKNLANAVKKVIAENGECHIKCICGQAPHDSVELLRLYHDTYDKRFYSHTYKLRYQCNEDDFDSCDYVYNNGCSEIVCEIVVNSIEEIYNNHRYTYFCKCGNGWINTDMLCMKAQLEYEDLDTYLKGNEGYALYIKSVIPYDEPQENNRVIQNFAWAEE